MNLDNGSTAETISLHTTQSSAMHLLSSPIVWLWWLIKLLVSMSIYFTFRILLYTIWCALTKVHRWNKTTLWNPLCKYLSKLVAATKSCTKTHAPWLHRNFARIIKPLLLMLVLIPSIYLVRFTSTLALSPEIGIWERLLALSFFILSSAPLLVCIGFLAAAPYYYYLFRKGERPEHPRTAERNRKVVPPPKREIPTITVSEPYDVRIPDSVREKPEMFFDVREFLRAEGGSRVIPR